MDLKKIFEKKSDLCENWSISGQNSAKLQTVNFSSLKRAQEAGIETIPSMSTTAKVIFWGKTKIVPEYKVFIEFGHLVPELLSREALKCVGIHSLSHAVNRILRLFCATSLLISYES